MKARVHEKAGGVLHKPTTHASICKSETGVPASPRHTKDTLVKYGLHIGTSGKDCTTLALICNISGQPYTSKNRPKPYRATLQFVG